MSKYRQFIFYVGTSCDNKKLRGKLKRLQDKLFKNILIQKESIILFFKKSVKNTNKKYYSIFISNKFYFNRNISAASNDKSGLNDKDKTERLVCFTLATLTYLETLVQKLSRLSALFPIDECKFKKNKTFNNTTYNKANKYSSELLPVDFFLLGQFKGILFVNAPK